MAWFDAGVNLLDSRFDIDAVIADSKAAGVDKLCVITTHHNEWERAKTLYEAHPESIVYTLGVHPHNAKDVTDEAMAQLPELFKCPGAVAVGECGLDFNRNFSPPEKQIEVFKQQLNIAKAINKPLYLHERDAFDTQISCLNAVMGKSQINGIAHCFTGTEEQLTTYLEKGLFIGITGWLCDDKRGISLRSAVSKLPLDRLVLETDAPYLFPKTVKPRQRNNTPAMIPAIAQSVAELMNKPLNEVENMSYTNTNILFGIA